MSRQEEVLGALAGLLDQLEVPYMVVGGHANALWGEPRATLDIDVSPRDRADVQGVTRRQGRRLDLDYLEPRIEELARLLDRQEIAEFWRSLDLRSSQLPP